MAICTNCQKNESTCEVFCFIPGVDVTGIHNTATLAKLCTACVGLLVAGSLQLVYPEDRMTLDELLEDLYR